MPGAHKNIPVGAESAHPLGYVQSADPGAVGANRPWMDTTDAGSGNFTPKIRNAADTGWLVPPYSTAGTPVSTQTGTTYTLALSDADSLVRFSNGAAITVTVPPDSSVAFPVGTKVALAQVGAGQVTVAAGSGVTVNTSATGLLKTAGQYAVVELLKTGADTWLLYGDREAAP